MIPPAISVNLLTPEMNVLKPITEPTVVLPNCIFPKTDKKFFPAAPTTLPTAAVIIPVAAPTRESIVNCPKSNSPDTIELERESVALVAAPVSALTPTLTKTDAVPAVATVATTAPTTNATVITPAVSHSHHSVVP